MASPAGEGGQVGVEGGGRHGGGVSRCVEVPPEEHVGADTAGEDPGLLRGIGDAAADADLAGLRRDLAQDGMEHRALEIQVTLKACSIVMRCGSHLSATDGADDGQELAPADLERDVLERVRSLVGAPLGTDVGQARGGRSFGTIRDATRANIPHASCSSKTRK